MKYLIIIFSLFINLYVANAQDSLVVKVCTTDCLNCYANFNAIKKLNDYIPVTLVFPDISKKEADYYMSNVLHLDKKSNYNIICSDSLYNSIENAVTSEVRAYGSSGKIQTQVTLEEFHPDNKREEFNYIKLPDSILFSQHVQLGSKKSIFMIVDYLFGQIFLLDVKNNKSRLIKAEEFTSPMFFNIACESETSYKIFKKYQKQLRYVNFDKVRFDGTSNGSNSLVAFVEVPELSFANDSTMYVTPRFGIVEFSDINNFVVYGIDQNSIPDGYFPSSTSFLHTKNSFYLTLSFDNQDTSDRKGNNKYIGLFYKKGNKLFFDHFINWNLTDIYQSGDNKKLSVVTMMRYPYIFEQYNREFYDLKDKTTKKLPFEKNQVDIEISEHDKIIKGLYSFKIGDVFVDSNYICLLYYKMQKKIFFARIDRSSYQFIENRQLLGNLPKVKKSSLRLLDSHHIYFMTSNNTIAIKRIFN